MTLTKHNAFMQYMIDVKGVSAEDAVKMWTDCGGTIEEYLSDSEITEMCEYAGVTRTTL